jgi:uncharacterized membrane protein
MAYEWLLFAHLLGAFLFVGGSVAAGILRLAALRAPGARETASLLRAVRPAVPLVGGGLVLAVAAGFGLAGDLDVDLGATWLVATYLLLGWLAAVGAVAGRQDRGTRELAERLAAAGEDDDELRRRLLDPVNLALNASLLAATVAVVALMVWKP